MTTRTSFAPDVANAVAEDDGGPVEPVQFTANQLREILAIATAEPLDAEATHNRWYHQMRAEGWCFGNTNDATRMSSYCRMFHALMPGQQALIAHELSAVIAARGAAEIADQEVQDHARDVAAYGFTSDQARELEALAATEPGTAEETHNRWLQQKKAAGWRYGGETNPETLVSTYCRSFHQLSFAQQALVTQCPGTLVIASDGSTTVVTVPTD